MANSGFSFCLFVFLSTSLESGPTWDLDVCVTCEPVAFLRNPLPLYVFGGADEGM